MVNGLTQSWLIVLSFRVDQIICNHESGGGGTGPKVGRATPTLTAPSAWHDHWSENCRMHQRQRHITSQRLAPQAAYRNCRGAVHVTDRAGVGPIGRWLSLRPQADLW